MAARWQLNLMSLSAIVVGRRAWRGRSCRPTSTSIVVCPAYGIQRQTPSSSTGGWPRARSRRAVARTKRARKGSQAAAATASRLLMTYEGSQAAAAIASRLLTLKTYKHHLLTWSSEDRIVACVRSLMWGLHEHFEMCVFHLFVVCTNSSSIAMCTFVLVQ